MCLSVCSYVARVLGHACVCPRVGAQLQPCMDSVLQYALSVDEEQEGSHGTW